MNLKQICVLTVVAAFVSSALPGYAQPEPVIPPDIRVIPPDIRVIPNSDPTIFCRQNPSVCRNLPRKVCTSTHERLLGWQQDFCDPSALQPMQNYQSRYFTTPISLRKLFDDQWSKYRDPVLSDTPICADRAYDQSRLLEALLTMYEATGEKGYLDDAIKYANNLWKKMHIHNATYLLKKLKDTQSDLFNGTIEDIRDSNLKHIVEQAKLADFKVWKHCDDTAPNSPPPNFDNYNKAGDYYRYGGNIKALLQVTHGFARIAKILSRQNNSEWESYYDKAFQPLAYLRLFNYHRQDDKWSNVIDASDIAALFVRNAVTLYEVSKQNNIPDPRDNPQLLEWARQVFNHLIINSNTIDLKGQSCPPDNKQDTLMNKSHAGMQKLDNDFVLLFWGYYCPNYALQEDKQSATAKLWDTSHANRFPEMIRVLEEAKLTSQDYWEISDINDWLRRMVNTMLFRFSEFVDPNDPEKVDTNTTQAQGKQLPKVIPVFANFIDGYNMEPDQAKSSYYIHPLDQEILRRGPYGYGNVTFGWIQLARYDARVLAILENLVQTLSMCEQEVYPRSKNPKVCHTNNSNPALLINAIAELAYSLKLQGR